MANKRRVDGGVIIVKKASSGWKERKSAESVGSAGSAKAKSIMSRGRDQRSYKEVVVGDEGAVKWSVVADDPQQELTPSERISSKGESSNAEKGYEESPFNPR
ncbi:hypothetical protein PTKIN_Ptkin14bG0102800 [Pterospermum kingtungense]